MGRTITLGTDQRSPRLDYVCHVLFRLILQADVVWADAGAPADLYYVTTPSPGQLSIPASGALLETTPPETLPPDHFAASLPDFTTADALAWAFFHLTEAAAYGPSPTMTPPTGPETALIEDLAFALSDALGWDRPAPQFDYAITIDVDHPWKHRYKAPGVQVGGFLRDLLKGRMAAVGERWRALIGRRDPFDIDELILEMCPAERTHFFFLVDGEAPQDSRFNLRMPAYAERVRQIQARGFACGLHPSYTTFDQPERLGQEFQLLRSVTGEVVVSRQHYLRYTLPQTFRVLCDLGIRQEYSTAFNAQPGARTRILRPYPWFDLVRNAVTEMEIVPAQVMDRTLQQYLGLDPAAAWPVVKEWIDRVRAVNGKFVVILHNETFSESGEWVGWRALIERMLAELNRP